MIIYILSRSDNELTEIIDLQKRNLLYNLPEEEQKSQGFLTVSHSLEDLKKMNGYERNLIVKEHDKIVGYLLTMTKKSRMDIPILISMFAIFDLLLYKNKPISEYNYLVVGQVCIDKNYRGLGILDKAYAEYKAYFKPKYDFAITEIATNNERSINAHKKIGFLEIHRYTDPRNTEWSIVVWDWS